MLWLALELIPPPSFRSLYSPQLFISTVSHPTNRSLHLPTLPLSPFLTSPSSNRIDWPLANPTAQTLNLRSEQAQSSRRTSLAGIDSPRMDQPRRHLQSTSSSSAVDLTGTPAGLATSLPPSPSLSPRDRPGSVARRRPSWSASRDSFPHPTVQTSTRTFSVDDDPFASPSVSPDDDTPPRSRMGGTYLTTQAGPSSASLIPTFQDDEDDEVHLTANMSHHHPPGWSIHDVKDPERLTGAGPRSRRKSNRYSTSPSPLKKTGTTLQSVSRSLRRMSIRVVNLAGRGLDEHVRLDDVGEEMSSKRKGDDDPEEPEYPALPDLRKSLPIRGRALGFMGPTNPTRLFMYRTLLLPYVVSHQRTGRDRLLTSCP